MTKTVKIILFSFVAFVLIMVLFFYFSFAGLPWKKVMVGEKVLAYLENKYGEEFEIEERYYNFKDGHYGIHVHPKKNSSLIFNAEEGWGGREYIDYYPEELWARQAKIDFEEIVKETYPDLSRYHVSTVYGEGVELVQGPAIPNYIDSHAFIDVHVNIPNQFQESEEAFQRMLTLIEFAQQNGGNIHYFIVYEPKETDAKDTFYISFTNEEIQKIDTIEDVKKYYNTND